MRLTRFTDYSLRALVYLAQNSNSRVTITEISEAYDISKNHLMKVISNLTRMGVVVARRGPGGGIRLSVPAADICLGDIVIQTEKHLQEQLDGTSTTSETPLTDCRLHDCQQQALRAYLDVLTRYTLADILGFGENDVASMANLTKGSPDLACST